MATLLIGFTIIAAYFATDQGNAVDQYSWERHARFLKLRNYKAFPLVLDNQFLLETDRSGYPQFFIYLYSLIDSAGKTWIGKYLYMLILAGVFSVLSGTSETIQQSLLIVLAICSSPLVIAVNRQVLPRFIGDLCVASFIVSNLYAKGGPVASWLLYFGLCYLIIGLHKMSLQLLFFSAFFVLPICNFTGVLSPISALCVAFLVYLFVFPGYAFARYQFEEHKNILMFWKRNIDFLGSRVFLSRPQELRPQRYRIRALILSRSLLVILPIVITLISLIGYKGIAYHLSDELFSRGAEVKVLVGRFALSVILILLASITCTTKRFSHYGSGLFYLTVPYIVGVEMMSIVDPERVTALENLCFVNLCMICGLVATNRFNAGVDNESDDDFNELCKVINSCPKLERLAIFPYTWSDRLGTNAKGRKILWGAHGCGGWQELNNVFPVMRLSIEELIERYRLDAFVVHRSEWDSFNDWGAGYLAQFFILPSNRSFSSFRLYIKQQK
jgi:hypothetical protein